VVRPDQSNPQSFDRYSYVLNNPLTNIDPSGHFSLPLSQADEVGIVPDPAGDTKNAITKVPPDKIGGCDLDHMAACWSKRNGWIPVITQDPITGYGIPTPPLVP